ncbi:MAG TPA: thioredoxin-like domain-containing protein [Opitutaceae bacterium]|nr:thioredoxin-like domain-containing protein [Opitutaceae bacterium]
MIKSLRLLLIGSFLSVSLFAQELTWQELARRPEFWPSQTSTKRVVTLQGLPPIKAGQKLTLVSIRGNEVEVETPDGKTLFNLKLDETDALAIAQQQWKTWTPEQRALTYAALLKRKDLWTYRVTLRQPVLLNRGEIKPGEQAILVRTEGNDLLLAYEKGNFLFQVPPRDTDLLDSARQLLANKNAFPSRVAEDLKGKLVHPETGAAAALKEGAQPDYFLFYRGAGWCGPCRQFSPSLVSFFKETKAKHPNYEVVFVSGDKTPAEMKAYSKEIGFTWPTVPQSRQPEMQIVNRLFTNLIPQVVVTDRQGTVVIDSARIGSAAALQQFAALLKKG